MQVLIDQETDRVLEAAGDHHAERRRALERERSDLTTQRDNVVSAVARGVLTDADAAGALARLRARAEQIAGERERLVALARDFVARARAMSGAALRELLRPWLEDAVVDKHRRTLTLTIRRVPNVGPFLVLSHSPGRGSR